MKTGHKNKIISNRLPVSASIQPASAIWPNPKHSHSERTTMNYKHAYKHQAGSFIFARPSCCAECLCCVYMARPFRDFVDVFFHCLCERDSRPVFSLYFIVMEVGVIVVVDRRSIEVHRQTTARHRRDEIVPIPGDDDDDASIDHFTIQQQQQQQGHEPKIHSACERARCQTRMPYCCCWTDVCVFAALKYVGPIPGMKWANRQDV